MSTRAACIGWRSSELPGLPASRDFPDGRRWPRTRFLQFVRGAQICVAPGERDMIAASPDWCACNSQCLHTATWAPQPALSVAILCWTVRVISPRRDWVVHILREVPRFPPPSGLCRTRPPLEQQIFLYLQDSQYYLHTYKSDIFRSEF